MDLTTSPFILAELNSDVDLDIQNCAFPNFTMCVFEWAWQFRLSPAVHNISLDISIQLHFWVFCTRITSFSLPCSEVIFKAKKACVRLFLSWIQRAFCFFLSSDGNTEWQPLFLMCHGTPKTWRSQKIWYSFSWQKVFDLLFSICIRRTWSELTA